MSEYDEISDTNDFRENEALKAAMPYILDEYRDAYAIARDGAALDIQGAIRDALQAVWRSVQANFYPMPKEDNEKCGAPTDDRWTC